MVLRRKSRRPTMLSPAPTQAPLALADFTLVGAFAPPDPDGGDNIHFGSGLAFRYKSGAKRLYSAGANGRIVEYAVPADASLVTSGTFPVATVTTQWGDICGTALYQNVDDVSAAAPRTGISQVLSPPIHGLYWDDIDQVLYWTTQIEYQADTSHGSNNCVGYSSMNDASGVGTGIGMWKLAAPGDGLTPAASGNRWCAGIVPIPSAFATAYCGGRRLGMGFGAGTSIITNGVLSLGPSLFAVDPGGFTALTNRDYFNGTLVRLMHYPYHADYASPYRAKRPSDTLLFATQSGESASWDLHTDYWTWGDGCQTGVWINGATKAGVVAFANLHAGNVNTTVSASPAPTHTGCRVANATGLLVGDLIRVETDTGAGAANYIGSLCRIQTISGNDLTFNEMTLCQTGAGDATGIPTVGGYVHCGTQYIGGGPFASRWATPWLIYNPADLALAAQGSVDASAIQPVDGANVQMPGLTYPLPGSVPGAGVPGEYRGSAFDPLTNRLYVYVKGANPAGGPLICVYAVNC